MAEQKKIVFDRPNVGDISQYNFKEEANLSDSANLSNEEFNTSTSLPKYRDKFQKKDLYTKTVGSEINEKIIERNLKFSGASSIKIDNIYIANTGVGGTVKNNRIRAWIFSEAAYGGDPTKDGYSTIKSNMKDEWKFYSEGFGNKGEGSDIGSLNEVEGIPIISSFGADAGSVTLGDFPGRQWTPDDALDEAFQLSEDDEDDLITSILNQNEPNPIYIVVFMQGNKKVAWPIKTDRRRRKYSIFKISNFDLFQQVGTNFFGTTYTNTFTSPTKTRTGEGGGGATQAAWKVSSLRITITTSAGVDNNFSDISAYQDIIPQVLPKVSITDDSFNSVDWLLATHPNAQLDNRKMAGNDYFVQYRHADFFPITSIGFVENNTLSSRYSDLQTYHEDFNAIQKSSVPLNVTFDLKIGTSDYETWTTLVPFPGNPDTGLSSFEYGGNLLQHSPVLENYGDRMFYYFVIDWDDKDDKFKTLQDWIDDRPDNTFDYLEKQNQNLYKVKKINYDNAFDSSIPSSTESLVNLYTEPGIKNLKFIIFSVFKGVEVDELNTIGWLEDTINTNNEGYISQDDAPDFEIGRWKLCTSRFYLDIPPNQYPDFGDVGGSDFTTLPWPFTTPIIGGVSENSNYKKSIQDTLSGGKIGELDIIDEKLLVIDQENNEMGQNIEVMDLEQVRYFNKNYNMNQLLNISPEISDNQPLPNSIEYYIENPNEFPFYFEEFDINDDGVINATVELTGWSDVGRTDISEFLNDIINQNLINTLPRFTGISMEGEFYTNTTYWNASTTERTFPMESSVGQIFINDNQDVNLKESCKLELNTGQLSGKSIYDSSGNSNKGLLIGDYKVKKNKKGQSMRRDSFIKVPKKTSNRSGAL